MLDPMLFDPIRKEDGIPMSIAHYMVPGVVSVDAETDFLSAVEKMRSLNISSVLVKRKEDYIGIFTLRDFLTKIDYTKPLSQIRIVDVMTSGLKTLSVQDTYTTAIEMMQDFKIGHLPVTKDGQVVGFVTLRDLLNHYQERISRIFNETINALTATLAQSDPYTAGHQARVSRLAVGIAEILDLPKTQIEGIGIAATLHDIGKVNIPSSILSKPGKLTPEEFALVKTHAMGTFTVLKDIEFPWPVAQIALQHHERLDGSGYPNKLTEDQLLLESKILAVADVVEAMASHRPYRPALGLPKALDTINQEKKIHFDSSVVDACTKLCHKSTLILEPVGA